MNKVKHSILIFIFGFLLICTSFAQEPSRSKPFDLEGVLTRLTVVEEYTKQQKDQKEQISGFQIRFSSLVTRFATESVGRQDLDDIRQELADIEQEILKISKDVEVHTDTLDELRVALEVNLRSIFQLKKSLSRKEIRRLKSKKNKITTVLAKIEKLHRSLNKHQTLISIFLQSTKKWKEHLASKAKKNIEKRKIKREIGDFFSNPKSIITLLRKDILRIREENKIEALKVFLSTNSILMSFRALVSVVLIIFLIKMGRVFEVKISLSEVKNNSSHFLRDILNLVFSGKVLFVFLSLYVMTVQSLGGLSYSSLPSLFVFLSSSILGLFFWYYFHMIVVRPRVHEVNCKKNERFIFRKTPLSLYIILIVFCSSFNIENILLDTISNLLLLFISYKFIWLSLKFKVQKGDGLKHYDAVFARSSKFLVLFFSSILFVSCFLNFFWSFSLGSSVQTVVFSNLFVFMGVWFVYQLLMINLDSFITFIDSASWQHRKRIVDVLVFIRNYSNVLLLAGFSYFVLNSWFHQLFVFAEFSEISLFKIGTYKFTIDRPFYILWTFFCIRLSHLVLLWSLDGYLLDYFKISRRHAANIYAISRYFMFLIYFLALSTIVGVTYKNLLIFASALGVGIGFGLQNIVNNFLSGIILLFERPIRVGDMIDVDGKLCHVKHLGIRSTVVQTLDNSSVIIPNSDLLSNKVVNWTLNDSDVALKCEVGVAYGTDTQKVSDLLLSSVQASNKVLKFPEPQVWFEEFGDSSLNFVLKVWIDLPEQKYLIKTDLMHEINRLFTENDIKIPFPQRDVNLVV